MASIAAAEQRRHAVAKLKRATSLPRMKNGRRPPMHPEGVSEGERSAQGGDTPPVDVDDSEGLSPQQEQDQELDQDQDQEETIKEGLSVIEHVRAQGTEEANDVDDGLEPDLDHDPEPERALSPSATPAPDTDASASASGPRRRRRSRSRGRGSRDMKGKARAPQSPLPPGAASSPPPPSSSALPQNDSSPEDDGSPRAAPHTNLHPLLISPIPSSPQLALWHAHHAHRLFATPEPGMLYPATSPSTPAPGVPTLQDLTQRVFQRGGLTRSNSAAAKIMISQLGRGLDTTAHGAVSPHSASAVSPGPFTPQPFGGDGAAGLFRNNTVTGSGGDRDVARRNLLKRLERRRQAEVEADQTSGGEDTRIASPPLPPPRRKRRSKRASANRSTVVDDRELSSATSVTTPTEPSAPAPLPDVVGLRLAVSPEPELGAGARSPTPSARRTSVERGRDDALAKLLGTQSPQLSQQPQPQAQQPLAREYESALERRVVVEDNYIPPTSGLPPATPPSRSQQQHRIPHSSDDSGLTVPLQLSDTIRHNDGFPSSPFATPLREREEEIAGVGGREISWVADPVLHRHGSSDEDSDDEDDGDGDAEDAFEDEHEERVNMRIGADDDDVNANEDDDEEGDDEREREQHQQDQVQEQEQEGTDADAPLSLSSDTNVHLVVDAEPDSSADPDELAQEPPRESAVDVEPATSPEPTSPSGPSSPLPPTVRQISSDSTFLPQLSSESAFAQLSSESTFLPTRLAVDPPSPKKEATGLSGWDKVKKAFVRTAAPVRSRSRTGSVRERSSSVSRESRGSIRASLSGSSKDALSPFFPPSPGGPGGVSPAAGAVSTDALLKYTDAKLFPFPGIVRLEEERRARGHGVNASSPDIVFGAASPGASSAEIAFVRPDELSSSSSRTPQPSSPSRTRNRTLSHQASDSKLIDLAKLRAPPLGSDPSNSTAATTGSSSTGGGSGSGWLGGKLPMTREGVKKWLGQRKKSNAQHTTFAGMPISNPVLIRDAAVEVFRQQDGVGSEWEDVSRTPTEKNAAEREGEREEAKSPTPLPSTSPIPPRNLVPPTPPRNAASPIPPPSRSAASPVPPRSVASPIPPRTPPPLYAIPTPPHPAASPPPSRRGASPISPSPMPSREARSPIPSRDALSPTSARDGSHTSSSSSSRAKSPALAASPVPNGRAHYMQTQLADAQYATFPEAMPSPPDLTSSTPDPLSSMDEEYARSSSALSSDRSPVPVPPSVPSQGTAVLARVDEALQNTHSAPALEPPRKLLMSSPVLQVANANTVKDRFLFLFTDVLVIAKPMDALVDGSRDVRGARQFVVKNVVRLRDMRFSAERDDPHHTTYQSGVLARHPLVRSFVVQFAKDPDHAISMFLDKAGIGDDPIALGQLLFRTLDLNRAKLGEYLARRTSKVVLKAYINSFGLEGLPADKALRVFLQSMHIPASTPKHANSLEYITDSFASRWYDANKSLVTYDKDLAVRLVRALIQLDEVLHGSPLTSSSPRPRTVRNITVRDFRDAFRRTDPRRLVPDDVLDDIYSAIRREPLAHARPAPPSIHVVFKRAVPPRLTFQIQSEPVIVRLPHTDSTFVIHLHGKDIIFEPEKLTFARSPEASFRMTGKALGPTRVTFERSGARALEYGGLPLSAPVVVERAFMRNTFQVAFVNDVGEKRRYMFSVDDPVIRHNWVASFKRQVALAADVDVDAPKSAVEVAAEDMAFQVLQDTLLSLQSAPERERERPRRSGEHVRSKSRSQVYHLQGAGRVEQDALGAQGNGWADEDSEEAAPLGARVWTWNELQTVCEQNSAIVPMLVDLRVVPAVASSRGS